MTHRHLGHDEAMTNSEPGQLRDYVAWHSAYDEPDSELSRRLRRVQFHIGAVLDRTAPEPVRVLSSCAGEGRDLLGVLAARDDTARVSGALLELHPQVAATARATVERLDLTGLVVREVDASTSDAYAEDVPADLVLLSGIMGNISADDIHRLVATAPQFCAPGATVIWTRGAMTPDLGPQIRQWFLEAGFEELACDEYVEGSSMRVGVVRYAGPPVPLEPGRRLFTFYR